MYRDKDITITVNDKEGFAKRLVVKKDTLWISQNLRRFSKASLPDRYLINICKFILRGGGFIEFLQIKGVVRNIASEAYRRSVISTSTRDSLYEVGKSYEKSGGMRYYKAVNIYDLKEAAKLIDLKISQRDEKEWY